MVKVVSRIRAAVEEILADFAKDKPDWTYSSTKKAYVHTISKDMDIRIKLGTSPKVEWVEFDMGIAITHKIVNKLDEINGLPKTKYPLLLFWNQITWIPHQTGLGNMIVYNPRWNDLRSFEEGKYHEGLKVFTHLDEFPARLSEVFAMAESAIARQFDISSEPAMWRSLLKANLGDFDSVSLMEINLLLDNPGFYETLVARYGDRFHKQGCLKQLELYNQGKYPKIDLDAMKN
jgi:hypothetical protein